MSAPGNLLHLLSALGNSVLNSFWQMGLLWLFVIAVSKYKKNITPAVLSMMSFAALLTGFIAFIITFILSFYFPGTNSGIFSLIENSQVSGIIMNYAAAAYLILLAIPLSKFLAGYRKVYLLKRKGLHRAPGQYKIFTLDMTSYLGIKKKVQIWLSDIAEAPLTVGFLKPIILLPVAAINQLSTSQVETIILHELAHIKKNDYLINFLCQIIITVLYFNPFAKALLNLHDTEREKTADNYVLQFEYDNQMYATTLLHLAKESASKHKFTLQLTGKSQLYNRVQWMMGLQQRPVPSFRKLAGSIVLMLFALLFLPATKNNFTTAKRFTGTTAEYISAKPNFILAVAENNSALNITETTTIENEITKTVNNTVYLKQIENPETGELEIVTPSEAEEMPLYMFATQPQLMTPILTDEQEQNVQHTVAAAKQVFAENNWQQIENSLAETATSEQKIYLKEAFKAMVDAADWSKQADVLRRQYQNIDWNKARDNYTISIAYIKLDSIYNHYTTALDKYLELKKELGNVKSEELIKKIAETEKILKQADSIRRKRVIEL